MRRPTTPPSPVLLDGTIANPDPDALTILLDRFDGTFPEQREEHDAVLSPRGHLLPARGDACKAIRTETGDWCVVWWDGGIPTTPYVSSLPVAPEDGDEVYLVASARDGVVWHLRYNAASSSPYKWEFIGGSALRDAVLRAETTTSTTSTSLATAGPSITVPVAGDYDMTIGARAYNDTVGQVQIMELSIGGAAPTGDNLIVNSAAAAGSGSQQQSAATFPVLAVPARAVVLARYRVTGGTGNFDSRRLRVTPVRVG